MASESADGSGDLTYEPHFGLREKPFSLSADPRFLFKSRSHAVALTETVGAIHRREGLVVLSGEVGTGKTMLCRAVIDDLDRRTFSAFVADPFVSREDLLRLLLTEFGVTSEGDAGALAGATRHELSCRLYEFLRSLAPLQAFAVVMIDEAQNLTLPLLEEIRILADLEGTIDDRRYKLLQVVLVGQPELRERLKVPQLRQVNQRVTMRCELRPLGRQDVETFVAHRLNVAAGGTSRVRFTAAALDALHQASAGVPRLINLIADRAMHEAYLLQAAQTIEAPCVWKAIGTLGLDVTPARAPAQPGIGLIELGQPHAAPGITTPRTETLDEPFQSEAALKGGLRGYAARVRDLLARRRLIAFALTTFAGTVCAGGWTLSAADTRWPQLPQPPAITLVEGTSTIPRSSIVTVAEYALLSEVADTETMDLPPDPDTYVIEVALFSSTRRARESVQELNAEGHPAYSSEVRLGSMNHWFIQVLAGSYRSLEEAEAALESIRQIPGYEDARLRASH
jgi:type II secretory pathway predicted ATPase ExeA